MDRFGNEHRIFCFSSATQFAEAFGKTNTSNGVIWHINGVLRPFGSMVG